MVVNREKNITKTLCKPITCLHLIWCKLFFSSLKNGSGTIRKIQRRL